MAHAQKILQSFLLLLVKNVLGLEKSCAHENRDRYYGNPVKVYCFVVPLLANLRKIRLDLTWSHMLQKLASPMTVQQRLK